MYPKKKKKKKKRKKKKKKNKKITTTMGTTKTRQILFTSMIMSVCLQTVGVSVTV